ncbi:MAG: DNA replication/repair protein RecF [Candidatus Tyrphobacter sp.]
MRLARLALSNFRNYEELELEPERGLNVFVGANAQGKSNLLEAIAMLGVGKSFRAVRDVDTIRDACDRAVIRAVVERSIGEPTSIGCTIARTSTGSRKTFVRERQSVPYATFLGTLAVVAFVPADLALVTGPPSRRRSFLNTAIAQADRAYFHALARYESALRQKNALLRDGSPNGSLLEVYDAALAEHGATLVLARRQFIAALGVAAAEAHARWTDGSERFDLGYLPNVPVHSEDARIVEDAIAARIAAVRGAELARKTTLCGPHRDDLSFVLDGKSLAAFGSQGQQRTAVLAVKAGEYAVMRDRCGSAPLLLLDDLLSELDERRAGAFLAGIGEYEQAFVTATHLPDIPRGGAIFAVQRGAVRPAVAC